MSSALFEITVGTAFAAAHALRLPDGGNEPTHGHTWSVTVTVARPGLDAMETVMDFHKLERLVHSIVHPWHNRNLNEVPPFTSAGINPSAERVAEHIAQRLGHGLPEGVDLVCVTVGEAPGCIATYRPTA